jgi:hypothetical protein
MKKQAFGIVAVFSLLLVLSSASVQAQSKRNSINIPFNFNVGQTTLPASEYTVEPTRKDSQNVWLLENKNRHASVVFTTIPVWTRVTQEQTKLVFNRYDDQYFLSQICTAGDNSSRELRMRYWERQLAKNGVQPEKVLVTPSSRE